jgi:uncharacterized protein YcfL
VEVIKLKKKLILGLMTSLLLAGVVGCSSDKQSTDNKINNKKETQNMSGKKMNMSDDQMKKMKSSNNK